MFRKSHTFKTVENKVLLRVETRCPEKWLLIDQETGQVYRGSPGGYWDRMEPVVKGDGAPTFE